MFFLLTAVVASILAFAAPSKPLDIILKDGTGKQVGTAKISGQKKGVKIHLQVEGLSPGEHAIHFHEKGQCTAPDFKSAGSHLASPGEEHGFSSPKGPHRGDMRNFSVGADGKANVEIVDERVGLGKGNFSLQRKGGTSLVIHAKPDDYKSQPSGDSGDRAVCGEISGG